MDSLSSVFLPRCSNQFASPFYTMERTATEQAQMSRREIKTATIFFFDRYYIPQQEENQ